MRIEKLELRPSQIFAVQIRFMENEVFARTFKYSTTVGKLHEDAACRIVGNGFQIVPRDSGRVGRLAQRHARIGVQSCLVGNDVGAVDRIGKRYLQLPHAVLVLHVINRIVGIPDKHRRRVERQIARFVDSRAVNRNRIEIDELIA